MTTEGEGYILELTGRQGLNAQIPFSGIEKKEAAHLRHLANCRPHSLSGFDDSITRSPDVVTIAVKLNNELNL